MITNEYSDNRRYDYCATHGHVTYHGWTQCSRHAAEPRFQSTDQCWVCVCSSGGL